MTVGTKVKVAAAVTLGVIFAATRLSANTNNAADAKFFSKITTDKPLFQDTTRQKVNPIKIAVNKENNRNFDLLEYKYDNGTEVKGMVVSPYYPNYLKYQTVSDYIVLEYADKVVIFRPNQGGKRENVVFEKKNGAVWTVEPKAGDPAKLIVTIDGASAEVSHDQMGKLHPSNQMGTVIVD